MYLPFDEQILSPLKRSVSKGGEYHPTQQQKLHQHKFILPCPGLIALTEKRQDTL